MLEELLKLVSSESTEQIVNNPQIPNEQNSAAIETTTSSIFESLRGQINSGNGADVLSLLGGQSNVQSSPVVRNLTTNVTNSLMDKLGIDSPAAKQVAASLVPLVLTKLVSRTNDPNDKGFDLNSIFGSLTDGRSGKFDMGSVLGSMEENNPQSKQSGDIGNIFSILSGK